MNTNDFDISVEQTILGRIWFATAPDCFDVLDNGTIVGQGQGVSLEEAIECLRENLLKFNPELF